MATIRLPRPGFLASSARQCQQCRAAISTSQWRSFNLTTPSIESDSLPPDPPTQTPQTTRPIKQLWHDERAARPNPNPPVSRAHSPQYDISRAPTAPASSTSRFSSSPVDQTDPASSPQPSPEIQHLPPALRTSLALLSTQPPHYIIIHIHGKPYLVTAGDTIRLPFLMHGVMPGDVLRLDRASQLGSREYTLRAGAARSKDAEMVESEEPIIGKTSDLHPSITQSVPAPNISSALKTRRPKATNRLGYIDPNLFVCRATVLGTESEPLRVKEKTKRRQRRTKHVYSKHRYTILRVSEVTIKGLEGLDV